MDKDVEAGQIHERVKCAYLDVSYGIGFDGVETPVMLECHNLRCGPMHGCDFYDKGECEHRSAEVNPLNLYKSDGWLEV